MQVKDSKVKNKPINIVLPCLFIFFIFRVILLLLRNLYTLFFDTCILVLLLELRKIVKMRVNFRKIVNFHLLHFISCNICW